MNECFYVFRIIISCVFVYLDSIRVSHSFYDAKIGIISIAYIRFYQNEHFYCAIVCANSMQTFVIGSDESDTKKVRPNFGHTNIITPIIEY